MTRRFVGRPCGERILQRTRRWMPVALALALLSVASIACAAGQAYDIDFTRPEPTPAQDVRFEARGEQPLRIGVAPVLSPRTNSALYDDLASYLAIRLGRPVELVHGKTYTEINDLVKSGDIAVALVCTNPYLQGQADFGMELLAVPQVHGGLEYYSLLIVGRGSEAKRLADLRGASFAFSDPLSNSGRLVPTYELARLGSSPDAFFSQTIFTYSHEASIRAVAAGVVAGAAVDSLVFEYLASVEPELASRVQVIERWGPFGINPLAVNPRLDEATKSDLRRVFLEMDSDPDGRILLEKLDIDRFVPGEEGMYDSVREMRAYLRERGLAP